MSVISRGFFFLGRNNLMIHSPISRTNQPLRSRTKKGPKRTAKRAQRLAMAPVPSKAAAELDADLDNYMSVAPTGLLNP